MDCRVYNRFVDLWRHTNEERLIAIWLIRWPVEGMPAIAGWDRGNFHFLSKERGGWLLGVNDGQVPASVSLLESTESSGVKRADTIAGHPHRNRCLGELNVPSNNRDQQFDFSVG